MPTQSLSGSKPGFEGTFENMLQDCFSCGVIATDFEGKIISVNSEAKRLLHLPSSAKRRSSLETLPPQITSLIREVFKTGETVVNRKISLPPVKGASTTLSVTAMPVSGKLGSSVVAMLNDHSAASKLELNLRRLDRLASVGTLSASLAHEIKNSLVAVKTFVDLLLEKNQDTELSGTVRREIGRMDAMVNHMLKYATSPKPVLSQIRLHEVLEHALHMMHPRIGSKMISLKREFNALEDRLVADDHQMEQAFLNLLLNAVDAIGEEGVLTIATELLDDDTPLALHDGDAKGSRLCIRISDTGDGIPPEKLQNIFEPFFTTKPRGTGLGLAITRRIIEEHHGTIRVESQPGRGTTFTIVLPTDTGAER